MTDEMDQEPLIDPVADRSNDLGESARAQELLAYHRDSIDRLDMVIINALAERFKHTDAVGILKAKHGLPVSDRKREIDQEALFDERAKSAGLPRDFANKYIRFVVREVLKRHLRHR